MLTTLANRPKPILGKSKLVTNTNFDRPIAKSEISFEEVDWFSIHKETNKYGDLRSRDNPVLDFLYPISATYFSPLNPVFISADFNEKLFNTKPIWMARDGLLPLLWFYKFRPTPGSFKGKILVHEDFTPFVPKAWRNQTGSYRVSSLPGLEKQEIREVVFTGVINEGVCEFESIKQEIEKLEKAIGTKKLNQISKLCIFIEKQFRQTSHRQDLYPKIMLELIKATTTENFSPKTWEILEDTSSFKGSLLVDFNEKNLFADSAFIHRFLGRGGRLFGASESPPPDSEFVQLSAFHGIHFRKKIEGSYALDSTKRASPENSAHISRFQTLMRSHVNTKLPWDLLMKEWSSLD